MKAILFKIAIVLLVLTAGNRASALNNNRVLQYTELTWIQDFYKIEVHGNVQLHLLSGDKNKIEMNNTYFNHNALVQVENGVLRITCYRAERLDVWVTAKDLRALNAYDSVLVQTYGKFMALEFDVELFDKAKANLNLECCFTNIELNDSSMANISGSAIESEFINNYASTLNATNFTAGQISRERLEPRWESRTQFAGLYDTKPLSDITDVKQQPTYAAKAPELSFATAK